MWNCVLLALSLFTFPAHALTTAPNSLRVEDNSRGNVLLGSEQATIERGELFKSVLLLWGKLDIYGEVDEVLVLSGHVTFHAGSKLNKSLVVMGGAFDSEAGADVAADRVKAEIPGPLWRALLSAGSYWRDNVDWISKAAAGLVSCLVLWLLGWALFGGVPKLQELTSDALIPNWPKNLALGLIGSVGAFVVGVLLVISILGLVIVPFYILGLFLCSVISYLGAAVWTGHRLLPPKAGKKLNPWGLLLGLLAMQFLWVVPVWWAALPVFALWTLSWGALVRSSGRLWK